MDERRAIERLKGGDPGGLEGLVKAHQVRAVRAAYLICRDRPLAEDVVQGAFVKAYEKIETFDGRRPFGPWFTRMVVNDAIKAASRRERTTRHEGGSPDALLEDPGTGPHELLEEAEERRRVWAALAKLPPAQRAAVVQRYYLGMSEAEMAGGGGSPPGTIKWRLHAARRRLSKLLRSQFREAPALSRDATEGGSDRG
jgi:RNA polymerase sigma-70 factor, ECF subfamily